MTIGWATLGIIWRRPICAVLVRPSRYTYGCMEATGDFTVNVPTEELANEVALCGSKSGRDLDKFAECGFTATESSHVKSPGIAECVITYECSVVQKNDVVPEHFIPDIDDSFYASGDYHRVYFGEIKAAWAAEDFRSLNGQIEYLLTECVRQRKKTGKYVPDHLTEKKTPEE